MNLQPLVLADGSSQPAGKFIVAVADNCSTDGTVEKIRAQFPWVLVYPQQKNLGFGSANNTAIRSLIIDGISFDAICLLNNDTCFDASAIIKLRQDLDRAKGLKTIAEQDCMAVIAPTILNTDSSRQNNFFAGLGPDGIGSLQFFLNAFRRESSAARILEGTLTPIATGDSDKPLLETHWASAVCWILSRKLWEAVGGFDEKIFMYYEDADLALSFRKLGARFFISQESVITHLGGGSANNNLSRAQQHDRAQQYVFQKHFGFRGKILSKSFRATRSLMRMLSALPRCFIGDCTKQKREYFQHHLALFREVFK